MELQRTKSRLALKTSTTQNVNREIGEIFFSIDQKFPDFFLRFIVNKLCIQKFHDHRSSCSGYTGYDGRKRLLDEERRLSSRCFKHLSSYLQSLELPYISNGRIEKYGIHTFLEKYYSWQKHL